MQNEATQRFIREHRFDDIRELALHSKTGTEEINFPQALTQIEGRQTIEKKIPSWFQSDEIMYPSHLALEQCSSEATARYKASLLSGSSFADLTGGFGVDFAFIAPKFKETYYIEKQPALCKIAACNFKALGLHSAKIENADARDYLQQMHPVDVIFIDPGRRSDTGQKVSAIEDCEPDLIAIQDLLLEKAENVLIKLSPMLDISQALAVLKNVAEVHVVSLENECKELLFLLQKNAGNEAWITCVNFSKTGEPQKISFNRTEEKECRIDYTSQIEKYLYEPNASILKAGFFKGITRSYPICKLHPDSHLYTSSQLVSDFPGRIFQVEASSSFNKNALKIFLQGIDHAHVSIRNFPLSVAALRKKLKVKEGGEMFLFATTLADGKHIILKLMKYHAIF
ncbi:MAG: class I SAM-dependent methyltransferase [Dysgonamonadaceae bacterium]|jgi:16S rRNA G966 N2-methylase RsmD|nr:class I SAM-dependent methyltransferase [Dysgonamonadaceae bacterium]